MKCNSTGSVVMALTAKLKHHHSCKTFTKSDDFYLKLFEANNNNNTIYFK